MFTKKLNKKNIIIFYNVITIIKYIIINDNINIYDFKIDFFYLNIFIFTILLILNTFIKINNNIIKYDRKNN